MTKLITANTCLFLISGFKTDRQKASQFSDDYQFTIENDVLKGKVVPYHEEFASLGEFTLRKLEDDPDFVGQIDAVTEEEYTYGKMRERSVRCALWMRSQGLRPKDVVALSYGSLHDFAMPCFAALYLGAVFSPWDERANAECFSHCMNTVKPKMAFVSERSAAAVAEAAKEANLDVKIIVFGRVPGFLEFEVVIGEPGIEEVRKFACAQIQSSDEIAAIMFSSGTTGLPKGVALSHRSLALLTRQARVIGMPGNVCMTCTTPDWLSTVESLFMTLWLKTPRILVPPFEESATCAYIEKYRVGWVYLTPYMIDQLLKSDVLARYDLSSLNKIFYTGGRLATTSRRSLAEILPKVQIISCYGITEACNYIALQSVKSKPESCGEITENVQLKVIDCRTGQTLGANEKGELLVKFIAMMNCYYNDPLATAQLIDEEGWLHSGDIGYYDENGEIFVVDRVKDTLRYADFDISPSEFENVIMSHPGVKEVAVVGQFQPNGDDLPIAFVVRAENPPDGSGQVTEADILNLVATELQDSRKQLHAGVKFIDHLPKTSSDKIKRVELRELAKSMLTLRDD